MKQKRNSSRGETLVESLLAILILALISLFVTTSIATAARMNAALEKDSGSFSYEDSTTTTESGTMTVSGDGITGFSVDMNENTTGGGYVYYD